jgi:hypothetical protein
MHAALTTTIITPRLPVRLAGYGDRHDPANAVHDDLEARVLVVEIAGMRCCLVTCDLLGMTRDFSEPVRQAVAGIVDAPIEAVLTSCTHVHAGPSTLTGSDAIGWPVPPGYRDTLVERIGDAARRAAKQLVPVTATFGRGALPSGFAINRRGHALEPEAQLLVLDPVVTIANFGIHPTITGPTNLAVATDWVGPFRREVERRTGRPAMFLQGCQGDVNPAVTSWEDGDPHAWQPTVDEFASRLAAAVVAIAQGSAPLAMPAISVRHRVERVPIGDTVLGHLVGGRPGRSERSERSERAVELVDWTLGDLRVTAIPGEGFHGLEQHLRASAVTPLLLAGLAPEWHGYLPVPFTEGYEEGLSLGEEAVAQLAGALLNHSLQ